MEILKYIFFALTHILFWWMTARDHIPRTVGSVQKVIFGIKIKISSAGAGGNILGNYENFLFKRFKFRGLQAHCSL
jgi:hypothetical protein